MFKTLAGIINPREWIQKAGLPDVILGLVGLGLNIWAFVEENFVALAILVVFETLVLVLAIYRRLRFARRQMRGYRRAVRTLLSGFERHTDWEFASRSNEYTVKRNGDTSTKLTVTVDLTGERRLHFVEIEAGGAELTKEEQDGIVFDVRDGFGDVLGFDVQWRVEPHPYASSSMATIVVIFDKPVEPGEAATASVEFNWPKLNPEPAEGKVLRFDFAPKTQTRQWDCELVFDKRLVRKAVKKRRRRKDDWNVEAAFDVSQEVVGRSGRRFKWTIPNLGPGETQTLKWKAPEN